MSPSSVPQRETFVEESARNENEQLRRRVQALEAELDRLKAAATADLQSVQNLLLAETRKVARFKADLAKHLEESADAQDAKELLVLWRDTIRNGHRGVDVSLDSDRGKATMRAIAKRGKERVRRAILGVQYDDWAMGRTSKQDRPYNDLAKHILKDSDRFEHFERLYFQHHPEVDRNVQAKPRPQLALVGEPTKQSDPLSAVLERLPYKFRANGDDNFLTRCPSCENGELSILVTRDEHGERVRLHCLAVPRCPEPNVLLALNLPAGELFDRTPMLNDFPAPVRLPEHLVRAMHQLLDADRRARGVAPVRVVEESA